MTLGFIELDVNSPQLVGPHFAKSPASGDGDTGIAAMRHGLAFDDDAVILKQ